MRLLLLCHKPPFPPLDGGRAAEWQHVLGLAQAGHEVHVLSLSSRHHTAESAGRELPAGVTMEAVAPHLLAAWTALPGALFGPTPYLLSRRANPAFERRLSSLMAERRFDAVHIEGLTPTLHWRPVRVSPELALIYRAQNVEHQLLAQRAAVQPALWRRRWLAREARRLERFERSVWSACDGVLAISPAVAASVAAACATPVECVAAGLEVPERPPGLPADLDVFHLGALDWEPNRDGLRFLVHQVWPRVRRRRPTACLRWAGSGAPAALVDELRAPGVTYDGQVPDAHHYVRARGILVVPLRVGCGLRYKIVEALALGRPVVSTTVGAAGLEREGYGAPWIADGAEELADSLLRLLDDPALAQRLAAEGHRLARERYARATLASRAGAFYERLAAQAHRRAAERPTRAADLA